MNVIGAAAGGAIGLAGAAVGTYSGLRAAKGPRQRAEMVRLAALGWVWVTAVVAWLALAPRPWAPGAVLLTLPVSLWLPVGRRRLARARAEDEAGPVTSDG